MAAQKSFQIKKNYEGYEKASLLAQMVRNLPKNARDPGLIPVLGRSPGKRNGNPLQYSMQWTEESGRL